MDARRLANHRENEISTNCGPSLLLDPLESAFHDDRLFLNNRHLLPSPTRENERSTDYGPPLVLDPPKPLNPFKFQLVSPLLLDPAEPTLLHNRLLLNLDFLHRPPVPNTKEEQGRGTGK